MSEMHLRQPGIAYSGCGPYTENGRLLVINMLPHELLNDLRLRILGN